ncbi:PREDICTED: uncharacterized protein LOC104586051 [Nelumbo nucifera]|uniref:Uncharacterized protein LOC104586051 n=1 Tax=Nelumbo nucifera TaxID=4432 RepID=A0A1U7Z2J1_NELNU|nr:PREDICTED: uncharacterized protein LOC104586051 [Nelumbo nucifera]
MKPGAHGISRAQKSKKFQGEGPNWVLVAGGALLSTLSIQLGYKLKQALDTKRLNNASNRLKGNADSVDKRTLGVCTSNSNLYSFPQDEDSFHKCCSGFSSGMMEIKHQSTASTLKEPNLTLPLVTIPYLESNKENGVMWASSSPNCLEMPPKPFHHSNSSESPCVSESGSDIITKQEVINKLKQQLKRRDELILEMQDQITALQNVLNGQLTHSAHLQSHLEAANSELFESEREIQRLRKAIADHCVGEMGTCEKPMAVGNCAEEQDGHTNGFIGGENYLAVMDKRKGGGDRIEILKKEVAELKEVIEGKEYLLQSYKEQKTELSSKVQELQEKLASRVPSIL